LRATSRLHGLFLAYFSRPKSDRPLYRAILAARAQRIVQLGVGDGRRALRAIAAACRHQPAAEVRYTGIDLFEGQRDGSPGLSLKAAYKLLRTTGARVQLAPGDPLAALTRVANSLLKTDILIVSHDQQAGNLGDAWFYVPRMLHAGSLVFVERPVEAGTFELVRLPQSEVSRLAARPRRQAA
jgi:hypothetical protein